MGGRKTKNEGTINQIQPLKPKDMTAKEKAQDLISEYWNTATECAIIHVKGIIKELKEASSEYNFDLSAYIEHWQEVLTELEKM